MKAAACNATAECWRAYATHAVPCGESNKRARGGDHRAAELRGFGAAQKRALIVWGAAHDAVLARIDASRRAQVGSQLWAGARAAAAIILRQAGAGVGRKRAAEGPEDDDDARARVRQRASGGGGEDGDTIL